MGDDQESLAARIKELEAENRRLRETANKLDIRVSKKGGVSIYGLQRFPVTLYASQWRRILSEGDEILRFIEEHEQELDIRPDSTD